MTLNRQFFLAVLIGTGLCGPTIVAAADVKLIPVEEIVSGAAKLPHAGDVSTGQPNAEALRIAADAGYAAVIDLRGTDEDRGLDEKATVEALGMDYVSLPIADKGAINYANAEELDKLLAEFAGPVLLHCGSGNRVGALVALRQKLHGASAEDALEKGRVAGLTSLEGVVRERLSEKSQ
jgi:uncharacterized protein (TIGR01244 family)